MTDLCHFSAYKRLVCVPVWQCPLNYGTINKYNYHHPTPHPHPIHGAPAPARTEITSMKQFYTEIPSMKQFYTEIPSMNQFYMEGKTYSLRKTDENL